LSGGLIDSAERAGEEVYHSLTEDSVDAIMIAVGTTIAYTNRSMAGLLCVDSPEHLIGRDVSAWITEAEREDFVGSLLEAQRATTEPKVDEFRFLRADGQVRALEASVSLTHFSGQPACLCVCRDVTERRAAEERSAEVERVRAQLIYEVTHDLMTPLNSVKGYVDLMRANLGRDKDCDLDELRRMADVVARNAGRLEAHVNDLLDMLRLIEGRMEVSPAEHDVAEFLQSVAEEHAPALERRRQRLLVESDVRLLVFGRQRLSQVLGHLISNSSRFSPEGSIIRLWVERVGGAVRFSVTDEGVGLSAEDIPKLFSPFPDMRREINGGTGLGLSICKGIVELHGGNIWAESPGTEKGSTFSFTIPVAAPANQLLR
jgi:PAS domain S-box-containing protein